MDPLGYASVTTDDMTVSTNTETEAAIRANFALDEPPVVDETEKAPIPEGEVVEVKTDAEKPKAGKPRNDPQARVEAATAKEAAAKRERDEARAETARLRAELDAARAPRVEPPKPATVVTAEAEPDPADTTKYPDGQFDRKFLKDQARWEARQEIAEAQKTAQQQAQARQRDEGIAALTKASFSRFEKAVTANPAFWDGIHPELKNLVPTWAVPEGQPITAENALADSVFASGSGPELLRHLSDHYDEDYQRLLTLRPDAFFRELGRLEARLDAATVAPASTAKPSQAKPPIKPLGSSPALATDDYSDEESVDTHIARENARDRKTGRFR